jgi:hypothetical protein
LRARRAGHNRTCRWSSGNIKTDYIDPVHSSANWNLPEIANLHRQGRAKLLHRHAGCEKAALNATTEFLKPRSHIHDVAVKNDGAFDVADLADDHRSEMQTSAYPGCDAELTLKLAGCERQFITHRHETLQWTTIDGAAAFRPCHDHFVADIIQHFAAIIHHQRQHAHNMCVLPSTADIRLSHVPKDDIT